MFKQLLSSFKESTLYPLMIKEAEQLLRNKQLLVMLLFPPTFQLWLFCSALDPEPKNVNISVCDWSCTPVSRELTASILETHVFRLVPNINSEHDAMHAVATGKCDVAVVIPPRFNSLLHESRPCPVQVVIDGVDANTAGIVNGYLSQIFAVFNETLSGCAMFKQLDPRITFLYNPGLKASWFFIPGITGIILTAVGIMLAASNFVREKDTGTLDQLLMTPAGSFELIIAKIIPTFWALFLNVILSLLVGLLIFQMPFRGNIVAFAFVSAIYMFVVIALGMSLATFSKNQTQAILTSFFLNIPMVQTSGALTPIEDAPVLLQRLAVFNPLFHYESCLRGLILKGTSLASMWTHVLALILFAVILMAVGSYYFRRQLE
ncbi:MAG TPA: ABC transporter permease [Oculatellaceae cyanobacterium]